MDNPNLLILDMGPQMQHLCKLLESPNIPIIDNHALLNQIVEIICYPREAQTEIFNFKKDIITTDLVYSGVGDCDVGSQKEMDEVIQQIDLAANELLTNIKLRGLIQNDFFNYEYKNSFHDQTIVFRRSERS